MCVCSKRPEETPAKTVSGRCRSDQQALHSENTSTMSSAVRPSFPMMTITSSMMMMMMMSCLVDRVGAEVANQSNSGLQYSSTLGACVCRAG